MNKVVCLSFGPKLTFIHISFCYVFFPQDSISALQVCDKVTPLRPLTAKSALSNEDIMRYSRQLLLPELGVQGMKGDICSHPNVDIVSMH